MKLTKLILVLFLLILTTGVLQSQNMTVTLYTGGLFTIKDASNDYFSLNQTTGQVRILQSLRFEPTENSSTGVIFKGANRFIHNFKPTGVVGYNTFIGLNSGNFSMYGTYYNSSYNTGVGASSLFSLTTGNRNTAVGYESLHDNTTGVNNTAVGYESLLDNTTGHSNTAVGLEALRHNTTGEDNTAVGYTSGSTITTAHNSTCLGYNAEPLTSGSSNQITLGNNQITSLRCNVQQISSLSDARDKKNIKDLTLGLDFLMRVKPRQFNWDRREWYEFNVSDGSKIQKTPMAGFVAQELDEVQKSQNAEWLNLVLKDNPDRLEGTPGNLLPIMVKAIQELKIENDELKQKLSKYEQVQSYLVSEIEKLNSKEGEILKTSLK